MHCTALFSEAEADSVKPEVQKLRPSEHLQAQIRRLPPTDLPCHTYTYLSARLGQQTKPWSVLRTASCRNAVHRLYGHCIEETGSEHVQTTFSRQGHPRQTDARAHGCSLVTDAPPATPQRLAQAHPRACKCTERPVGDTPARQGTQRQNYALTLTYAHTHTHTQAHTSACRHPRTCVRACRQSHASVHASGHDAHETHGTWSGVTGVK